MLDFTPPPKKNPFKTVVNMNLTDWLHVIHFWNWNAIMMLITIIKSCLRLRNYIFSTLDSLLYMHIDISLMPSLSNWSPVFSREGGGVWGISYVCQWGDNTHQKREYIPPLWLVTLCWIIMPLPRWTFCTCRQCKYRKFSICHILDHCFKSLKQILF